MTLLYRLALDRRDWLAALLKRWYLPGLEGPDEGKELVSTESLERAPVDWRGRIAVGSKMTAMAFWVR